MDVRRVPPTDRNPGKQDQAKAAHVRDDRGMTDTAGDAPAADNERARPIGRLHHLVLDCRDPAALAQFWSRLLGLPVTYADDEFVVVSVSQQLSGLAFQLSPGHVAPVWPGTDGQQQMHLDVMVDDVAAATDQALGIGARRLSSDGTVFADPAGHPFCLIPRPGWAPPVRPDPGALAGEEDE